MKLTLDPLDLLALAGAALVLVGLALVSWPLMLVAIGAAMIAASFLLAGTFNVRLSPPTAKPPAYPMPPSSVPND